MQAALHAPVLTISLQCLAGGLARLFGLAFVRYGDETVLLRQHDLKNARFEGEPAFSFFSNAVRQRGYPRTARASLARAGMGTCASSTARASLARAGVEV